MLIVALAAGLLTQFFPCCAFAIRSFSKVSATPGKDVCVAKRSYWCFTDCIKIFDGGLCLKVHELISVKG